MTRFPGNRYFVFFLIAGAGLFWDLFSKSVVFDDLGYPGGGAQPFALGAHEVFDHPQIGEGESSPYIQGWTTFRLFTSFNRGALWGVGQGYSWVFASLSVLAIIGIVYWLFARGEARSLWLTTALALIMGGTLGNLFDRIALHGYVDPTNGEKLHAVRDFLLFTFGDYSWPVFNFADVYLVTGAIMLVVQSIFVGTEQEEKDVKSNTQVQSDEKAESSKTAATG